MTQSLEAAVWLFNQYYLSYIFNSILILNIHITCMTSDLLMSWMGLIVEFLSLSLSLST